MSIILVTIYNGEGHMYFWDETESKRGSQEVINIENLVLENVTAPYLVMAVLGKITTGK